jgi:hypothetical protein
LKIIILTYIPYVDGLSIYSNKHKERKTGMKPDPSIPKEEEEEMIA